MKRLIFILTLLFQVTISFGQTIGTELEGKDIYKSGGLYIHYSIVYMGSGDCGTKYKVDISIDGGETWKASRSSFGRKK